MRIDDFTGVKKVGRIKGTFHFLKVLHHAFPEHGLVKLRARYSVSMFTRVRALVFAYHFHAFLGYRTHLGSTTLFFHI